MLCSRTVGVGACGSPAQLRYGFEVCESCWVEATSRIKRSVTKHLIPLGDSPLMDWGSGWVYFVLTPTGLIKIGHTTRLFERLRSVSADNGGKVSPLALTPGGFLLEQKYHAQFHHLRVLTNGEVFSPAADLMATIHSLGLPVELREDLVEFANWRFGTNPYAHRH